MNTQVNWQRIRSELQRLADVDKLKDEVQRIGTEIRNFDFHSVLSPAAQVKVKTFEKRYTDLMRNLHQAQRQVDREMNRILRNIKVHRTDVSKAVTQQKQKLEKVSADFKKRFAKLAKASAATSNARRTPGKKAKAAGAKKRTKAKSKA